jgi:hypothetical protein
MTTAKKKRLLKNEPPELRSFQKRIQDNIDFKVFWKRIPKPGTVAMITIDEMEKFARNVWLEARK